MAFDYSNLSDRPPGRFVSVARRVLRGVARVEDQIPVYAAAWHAHNVEALGSTDPLWVVLGDSLSQGVGASSIEYGWVLQTRRALAERGLSYRVVNLSISGARVAALPEHFQTMLDALPVGTFVGVVPHAHGVQAQVADEVDWAAVAGRVVAVPLRFAPHERASDHFHPNDVGYAAIAAGFTDAIAARRRGDLSDTERVL